ncbi:purine-cytosine permease-like protein [Streptomyces glaucescens]
MFPRLSRVRATVPVGVVAVVFIFVGRFALDLVQSISTFATMIVTCTTPWMVVMMPGGGRYWFAHGWNWRGMTAWWAAAAVGVLFANIPGQFVGPLGGLAGGVDVGLPLSLAVAAVLFPDTAVALPRAPRGLRPGRRPAGPSAEVPVPPVTGPGVDGQAPDRTARVG